MYFELHAYQHHVFMDWRFVDDEKWQAIYDALNGAGVESMQAKWEEMFGEKKKVESEKEEVVKVKKPRKKVVKQAKEGETKKRTVRRKTSVKKPVEKNIENKP